ncbi:MAG: thioredoxin family protein [Lachnospiraceae bacterium]|nr:thioredoxin family protein [Lachnospiraceae bacterium]
MSHSCTKWIKCMVITVGISLFASACGMDSHPQSVEKDQSNSQESVQTEVQESPAQEEKTHHTQGVISSITMAQMENMLAAGETFLISFVTTTCPYCHDFHDMLVEYNKEHNILMYQVILDYEETGEEENRAIVSSYFEEFNTVPGVFYVEDGKNSSYLDTYHLGVGEDVFDQWIQDNNIQVPVN